MTNISVTVVQCNLSITEYWKCQICLGTCIVTKTLLSIATSLVY